MRCDTPSGREGFVALGLSSNGGVDAVLFHELGMSSVVNFVREMNGVLTRSSPHVATEGDVSRLTGRNALPKGRESGHRRARARVRVARGDERRDSRCLTPAWACTCRARS